MDGRERGSHAEMNNVICSVSNPDVYYEENPKDPMHPIEKPRTGSMVHLHPGEDFQCRCSMVMWDPYINGSYEVKEEPQKEQEEKTKTTAEILQETEQQLENARKQLETANRKTELLQQAQARHAARTQADAEVIREKWRKHWVKQDLKQKGHSKEYIENVFAIEKNIGVKYTGEMTHEQADTGKVNPNYVANKKFYENCQSCVVVYELRRRGFKIEALDRVYGGLQDILAEDSRKAWLNPLTKNRVDFQNGRSYKFMIKPNFGINEKMVDVDLATSGDGRYFVSVAWKKSFGGAHVITAERKNGALSFYDPQNNKIYDLSEFRKQIAADTYKNCTFGIIRVDDAFLNMSLNFKELETISSI